MKKILVIGINYFPEITSTGLYTTEMVEYLKDKYQVEVLTGFPYYPQWEIYYSYIDKPNFYQENIHGVNVYRYKQYVPKKITAFNRLRHLYDFYKGSTKIALKKKEKFDMLFVVVPTLFSAKTALKLKDNNPKAKLWLHIQDFEVDAMFESELLNNRKVIKKLGYWWEKRIYSKFDVISSISEGMLKKLELKDVEKNKIFFLPNWADTNQFHIIEKPKFRKEMQLSDKFVIMYAGSIAEKQDWEIVMETAKKLRNKEEIIFIIIGNGSKRSYLENYIKDNHLKNIKLLDVQPKEKLNDILSSADIHIIPQKRDVIDSVMPSKFLGIASVGKPSLVLANSKSDIYRVVKENELGIALNEKEYDILADIITRFPYNQNELQKYGENARKYVEKIYKKEKILDNLIEKIDIILSNT
jgi:colanic acid biosynthesis glycosyl transferase WcaI